MRKLICVLLCLVMAAAVTAMPAAAQEDYEKDETWLLLGELTDLYERGGG